MHSIVKSGNNSNFMEEQLIFHSNIKLVEWSDINELICNEGTPKLHSILKLEITRFGRKEHLTLHSIISLLAEIVK